MARGGFEALVAGVFDQVLYHALAVLLLVGFMPRLHVALPLGQHEADQPRQIGFCAALAPPYAVTLPLNSRALGPGFKRLPSLGLHVQVQACAIRSRRGHGPRPDQRSTTVPGGLSMAASTTSGVRVGAKVWMKSST